MNIRQSKRSTLKQFKFSNFLCHTNKYANLMVRVVVGACLLLEIVNKTKAYQDLYISYVFITHETSLKYSNTYFMNAGG